jgi:hypothetical protein
MPSALDLARAIEPEMTAQGLHHPRFGICEQALAWGAALHVHLVRDRAENPGAKPAP